MTTEPPSTIPTVLGIDPGTRYLGAAVVQGRRLLRFGVHQLRNGERPYDIVGQARRIVLGYVARHAPQVVAIEELLAIASPRGAVLQVIAQELDARSRELGICVVEVAPREVRRRLTGNARATKIDVAEALVRMGFEELRAFVPVRPRRSALGLRPRDKYWLHGFDAVAIAVSVHKGSS